MRCRGEGGKPVYLRKATKKKGCGRKENYHPFPFVPFFSSFRKAEKNGLYTVNGWWIRQAIGGNTMRKKQERHAVEAAGQSSQFFFLQVSRHAKRKGGSQQAQISKIDKELCQSAIVSIQSDSVDSFAQTNKKILSQSQNERARDWTMGRFNRDWIPPLLKIVLL